MTNQGQDILTKLEARIRQLIRQDENLREQIRNLESQIAQRDEHAKELVRQREEAEANYANLKVARMLELSDSDTRSARQRLNYLVREVDKCIPLSITLKFGTRTLPMVVERRDEYIYREAEKLINSRYAYYASKYLNQGHEMYLLMTALDVAVRLKRIENEVDPAPIEKALSQLLAEVEQPVQPGHAASGVRACGLCTSAEACCRPE